MPKHPKQKIHPPLDKSARQAVSPSTLRVPRLAFNPESISALNPVWKIGRIDVDGPWGHAAIDRTTLLTQILPKLKNYESMTWGDIERDHRRNHSVSVVQLTKEARDRLATLRIEEEQLFRFRLTGTQRMWGIRDRDTFCILWWDPNHEICPAVKKHT